MSEVDQTPPLTEQREPQAATLPEAPAGAEAARLSSKRPPRLPSDLFGSRWLYAVVCLLLLTPLASAKGNQYAELAVRKIYEWSGSPLDDSAPDTSQWIPGSSAFVAVTLVTEDEKKLVCASDEVVASTLRCEFTADKKLRPKLPNAPLDNNKLDVIQPYRTLAGNELILLSGVWAQPEIAVRAHQEPAGSVPVNRQSRFVAYCQVRFLSKFDPVHVRWFEGGQWFTEKAPVAQTERCATHDFRRAR